MAVNEEVRSVDRSGCVKGVLGAGEMSGRVIEEPGGMALGSCRAENVCMEMTAGDTKG